MSAYFQLRKKLGCIEHRDNRDQATDRRGRNSLLEGGNFSLFLAEGEV